MVQETHGEKNGKNLWMTVNCGIIILKCVAWTESNFFGQKRKSGQLISMIKRICQHRF